MQIKVKPISGQRLEIQLEQTQLLLSEMHCKQMREALADTLSRFALHPKQKWDQARAEFETLLPTLTHLEAFTDNDLALLVRELDFALLYRLCQRKQMDSLIAKLETACGRREIDRIVLEGERLPQKPLWEVNQRLHGLKNTIERMTRDGEIKPPRLNSLNTAATANSGIALPNSAEAPYIRQVLKKIDSLPEKAVLAICKQIPPRELAKFWFISEAMSEQNLTHKITRIIPAPTLAKLKPAKPSQLSGAEAKSTVNLAVEVLKGLQSKPGAGQGSKKDKGSSGPILI
ncbi:hypothetical protein SAMN02745127_01951 [Oceanospirillum multiglobuliferum]|uniref:Uncharacterized protein n=1 Tax=Oceanospirillum multiglobuliferum TaxID=64969 RepID=A0A1T4QN15_9GAMM|nr:hypothetical protein [Oceanospirillum multiglobuliferum]OPX56453.1 hypothetical protein BTE48_03225 [Oceanospirillum multiglobuliferum]SKA05152.1 hypothetical protein SAMN02745127_01951 [Oceanospirillum multiglobuliferum]